MKYVIILPDGAADEPVDKLDGRTPLAVARKPHIDAIARAGKVGSIVTVPEGFTPGSDVATLTLFGYDPHTYYDGRAPLEAVAQGIRTTAEQVIFRCNLITVDDGKMEDFTAGHISTEEASQIMADLNERVAGERCRFHTGVSYRHLMILSDADDLNVECTPPHDIPDLPAAPHLPSGKGADYLREIMERARLLLAEHEVNRVRRDLGENPATDIWLWGHGRPRTFPTFQEQYGLNGVLIAGVDLIKGIALSAGIELLNVPGATGYLDTDYEAKGRAAVEALDRYDLVIVHVEAPDEAGHQGNVDAKIEAIERIDEAIVGPVMARLQELGTHRILVSPDHPTPVNSRVHTAVPPCFCLAGQGIEPDVATALHEEAAAETSFRIEPGHELMEYFLHVSGQ